MFCAYQTSPQTIANDTLTQLSFDTEAFDELDEFSANVFTPKSSGLYLFIGSLRIQGLPDQKFTEISLHVDGEELYQSVAANANSNSIDASRY